jgi:uncharacterized protein YecT (DUF1311 family)
MTTLEKNKTYRPEVVRIGERMYWVQSATDRDQRYFVDLHDGTCECVGFAKRGGCWHLTEARKIEAEREAAARTFDRRPARPSGMAALIEAFGPSGFATGDYPF